MACFRCGRSSHFASECYATTSIKRSSSYYNKYEDYSCYRCGRSGHFASECFAKKLKNGQLISKPHFTGTAKSQSIPTCYICGIQGHYANECIMKEPSNATLYPKKTKIESRVTTGRREGVYVLKTKDNFYYVGKSNDIDSRIAEHAQGVGASCLAGRGVWEEIIPFTPNQGSDHESWERSETLHRMMMHGIDNVRGWMFTSPSLTETERNAAFRQICEKFDLCRRCGRRDHFADACSTNDRSPWAGKR